MFLIINKNNIKKNNILLYKKKFKIYKIIYNLDYIKLIGIPIRLYNININIKHNFYYIYLHNKENIILLDSIQKYINNIIKCDILKYNNNNFIYIICKNYNNKIINKNNNFIDINITKIKFVNNKYVPIINII